MTLDSETHVFDLKMLPSKPSHVGLYIVKIELTDNGNDQPEFLDETLFRSEVQENTYKISINVSEAAKKNSEI